MTRLALFLAVMAIMVGILGLGDLIRAPSNSSGPLVGILFVAAIAVYLFAWIFGRGR